MKIEIRPIPIKRWHGKTGKESFTRPKKIQALVDADNMVYRTGLTEEEQEKYEGILKADLSKGYNPETPHEFWDSARGIVKLENATMILDTEKPLDFIHWKIMRASKYVANSMKEYEEGLFPEATHVIFDESEEVEAKAKKIEIKNRAIKEIAQASTGKKREIILIIEGKDCKGKSEDFVTVEIDKIVNKKPGEVLRLIDADSAEVSAHAMVLECLQKSILRKDGHRILYHDSVLGSDIYDVIEYLLQDENQSLKLRLMTALNN